MRRIIKSLLTLLPAVVGTVWLAFKSFGVNILEQDELSVLPLVSLFVLFTVLGILDITVRGYARDFTELLILTPCILAPLAVAGHWTLAPTPVGMGSGGFSYFLQWLTRYPNFGPVNWEVLLGMICVLALHFLPAFFAAYSVLSDKPRFAVLFFIFLFQLTFYLPVLIRLDADTWRVFASQANNPWSVHLVGGPLFRFLPLIFMPFYSFFNLFMRSGD